LIIGLTYLKNWEWQTEYLAEISSFIPEINAVAIHYWPPTSRLQRRPWWKLETVFRRWLPRLRSKYIRYKLIIPPAVAERTSVIIISDELYRLPKKISALAVFKQYASDKDTTSIPFPLGIRRGFPLRRFVATILRWRPTHRQVSKERACLKL